MNKKLFVVLFFAVACFQGVSVARADDYVFTYVRAFYSSDHGITIKFDVDAVGESKLVAEGALENGSVYMATFATLRVNGKLHSRGSVSVIDETWVHGKYADMKRNHPHVLHDDFSEEEYASIAGKTVDVIFYVYGNAYPTRITFGSMPVRTW